MRGIEESIEVEVPVDMAYNQWTRFEQFPTFMEAVEEVRQIDDTHLHWAVNIGGSRHEWDAEITEQLPDERIAWKTVGGDENKGVVTFHKLADQRCKIMVQLDYEPQGVKEEVGGALGMDSRQVKNDLERFKTMIENRGAATGAWRDEVS